MTDHPVAGRVPVPVALFRFGSQSPWTNAPAPLLGQHTRKVLHELLGLGGEEYDELLGLGIVGIGRTDAEGSEARFHQRSIG